MRHPTLDGGLAFVERAASWGPSEVVGWIEENLVAPKRMARAAVVSDPDVGTAPLHASGSMRPPGKIARLEDVPRICANARKRVVETLRGFIGTPCDDRFIQGAIFADRVKRVRLEAGPGWVPSPRDTDALHNIALSLFVADLLARREHYEQRLCVCDRCGNVSFDPEATSRAGCAQHPARTDVISGFRPTSQREES
jgi:hypothetical protein